MKKRAGQKKRPTWDEKVLPDSLQVLPPNGSPYPLILRGEGYSWWRSLMGVVLGLCLFLVMMVVIAQLVVAIAWVVTGSHGVFADFYKDAMAYRHPSGMLGANLGIAIIIPTTAVIVAIVHRVRPRWLSSVQPRLRWRYLLIAAGVAVVALDGTLVLSTALSGPLPRLVPQEGFWGFLVVIVLSSPLQAAGEEIFFRGYLLQALGSLVAKPWFGVIVSSVIFALLHGSQNLPLFLNRLAFGLLAAVLVWRTGGLEAGIAAHVVNNISAYVLAGLTSTMAEVRLVNSIAWAESAVNIGGFALFAVLAYLVARRMKLRTTVDLRAVP